MADYLKRCLKFFLLLSALSLLLYFSIGFLANDGRMATIIDKHERVASLKSKKLILIGGSNLHYGVDSELLQSETGIEVANMGLHASLGLNFMLEEVKPYLTKGDIVILALESSHYYTPNIHGESVLFSTLAIYPAGIKYLKGNQYLLFPGYYGVSTKENLNVAVNRLKNTIKGGSNSSFRANNNASGDYLGHKDKSSLINLSKRRPRDKRPIREENEALIRDFLAHCKAKEVSVGISYSPIAASAASRADMETISETFDQQLIARDFKKYIYPDSFFFDTPDHLLFDKRSVRTLELADEIKNHWNLNR